jgi:hypothetical protein
MNLRRAAFLVVVGVACASCGGGGGRAAIPSSSLAEGTYVGAFVDSKGATGSFNLTVIGKSFQDVSATYLYPHETMNFRGSIGEGVDTLPVNLQAEPWGPSTMELEITNGTGTRVTFPNSTVVLIPNPTGVFGGSNPFSGSYSGTLLYGAKGVTYAMAINIAPGGAISGAAATYQVGSHGISGVSGALSAEGGLVLGIGGNPSAATGTVKLANGTISGSLKMFDGTPATFSLSQVKPL